MALVGLAALPPAEAMYMQPVGDSGPDAHWRGRLSAAASPPASCRPVNAFWSLTMYEATPDGQFFLVENPIERYSIGDRTPGLKKNADGSLDIWIARADPAATKSANWLPAPAKGPFSRQPPRLPAEVRTAGRSLARPGPESPSDTLTSTAPAGIHRAFQPPGLPTWRGTYDG